MWTRFRLQLQVVTLLKSLDHYQVETLEGAKLTNPGLTDAYFVPQILDQSWRQMSYSKPRVPRKPAKTVDRDNFETSRGS